MTGLRIITVEHLGKVEAQLANASESTRNRQREIAAVYNRVSALSYRQQYDQRDKIAAEIQDLLLRLGETKFYLDLALLHLAGAAEAEEYAPGD